MRKSITVILLLISSLTIAQNSREYIRQNIKAKGSCRNVAITKTNGDLMLYGRNGYAYSACPQGLTNAISELNRDNEYIDEVQLTENGRWLILYGDNAFRYSNVPYGLEVKMKEFNGRGDIITTATFNDGGDWIIISTAYFAASSDRIQSWLKEGIEKYGSLWTACITDDAMVAVYDRGYKYSGNVPESLKQALKETSMDVYRLKIAGTSWFFADKNGSYRYNM